MVGRLQFALMKLGAQSCSWNVVSYWLIVSAFWKIQGIRCRFVCLFVFQACILVIVVFFSLFGCRLRSYLVRCLLVRLQLGFVFFYLDFGCYRFEYCLVFRFFFMIFIRRVQVLFVLQVFLIVFFILFLYQEYFVVWFYGRGFGNGVLGRIIQRCFFLIFQKVGFVQRCVGFSQQFIFFLVYGGMYIGFVLFLYILFRIIFVFFYIRIYVFSLQLYRLFTRIFFIYFMFALYFLDMLVYIYSLYNR